MARSLPRSGFVLLVAILLATFTTPARAQTLPVPGSVNGSLNSGQTKNTYSLTVPADGNVTFTLTTSSPLYALLRFYDSNGTTQINYVYCNYGSTASLTIPHLGPEATYYVSVEIIGGAGSYTLSDTEVQPTYAKNVEPNNTYQTAVQVSGAAETGHVGYSTTSYYTQDNIDYYKFTIPADGDVTINITTDSTLYALLRFWDSNGTSQINYVYCNYGSTASLTIPHLAPGATYYASVEVTGGYGSYKATASEVFPPYAKNVEPNDTYQTAVQVLGTSETGHVGYSTTSYYAQDNIDYYKFVVPVNGDVTINLTTDSTLYALLRFWDSNGTSQISYVYCNYGSTASLTIPHLAPGATYYVSVEVTGGYGSYKAGGTIAVPQESAAKEPNDTYQQAQPFALNSSVTGNIGYSTTSYYATDNIDFWKVTVANAGTLTVKLTTDSTLYGLVRIYSPDGKTQLTYFYTNYGSTASTSYALPAAGTYYVSVEVTYGYGGYTLSNSF